ncbi:MAG: hypothetical protein CL943_00865 [Candidatus Diapherotrites archaeon]|uniref:KaiC domain-containing protein n=1 Tax=Candidatus Iainarchaeum sp. TaxID=3101447 RepID=A0A2D6M094_9ARCH|nr:hypothetical protein [Candidatus Diapherotrites archaeon]|tara:strand:- start:251 stop:1141 length:891 start_codon:yes stop_codon:yes gene_type:complete
MELWTDTLNSIIEEAKTKAIELYSKTDAKPANTKKTKPTPMAPKKKPKKPGKIVIMPARVGSFDQLLKDGGLEKGSTTLISGGAGTGKTTFCLQSLYQGAMNGEKGVFISFEEEPDRIKQHMKKNFGWDFDALEKKGLVAIYKVDPSKIARMVESVLEKQAGLLKVKVKEMQLPIKPDRVCIDSLSALSIAFESEDSYRKYIRVLFEMLEEYDSVNIVISETEQNPKKYSRTGVEEFLADGVVVLYNLDVDGKRKNALEILKLRSGKHLKQRVPYTLGKTGIEIEPSFNLGKSKIT